jgi:hypothetical protein
MAKLLGGTRIYGDAVVDDNLLLSGEIRGPASLIIDPATHGDNTGTVIIKGDLTAGEVIFNSGLIGDVLIVNNQISALDSYGNTGILDLTGQVEITGSLLLNGQEITSNTYTLPTATTSVLGGVKVDGTTITIDGNGVISGSNSYSLPTASDTVLGGIKIGTGLSIDGDGVVSATFGGSSYDQNLNTTDDVVFNSALIGDISIVANQISALDAYGNTGILDLTGQVEITGSLLLNGQEITTVSSIDDLTDVDTSSTPPVLNQALVWNGSNWVPGTPSSSSIIIEDTETLVSSDPSQTIDTFDKTLYRTAKYLIQAIYDNEVHATEVTITHNDIAAFINSYGTIYSGASSLITVSATVDSTNVYLKITPANANTVIDFTRISIVARTLGAEEFWGDLMLKSGSEDLMLGSGTVDLFA